MVELLDKRVRIVQAGYDTIAPAFLAWSRAIEREPSSRFLDELLDRLPESARVLDLGCGAGAAAQKLAERCEVVGVDVSSEQLRLARAEAPSASFLHGDFRTIDVPPASFDAVIALYSIVHVPRDEHASLFARIRSWLKPGGLFLASLSHRGGPDSTDEWLGVPMFFSGFDRETNARLVGEAGFDPIIDELVFMHEPDYGEIGFHWVLARA